MQLDLERVPERKPRWVGVGHGTGLGEAVEGQRPGLDVGQRGGRTDAPVCGGGLISGVGHRQVEADGVRIGGGIGAQDRPPQRTVFRRGGAGLERGAAVIAAGVDGEGGGLRQR